jgi:hypothetical protein
MRGRCHRSFLHGCLAGGGLVCRAGVVRRLRRRWKAWTNLVTLAARSRPRHRPCPSQDVRGDGAPSGALSCLHAGRGRASAEARSPPGAPSRRFARSLAASSPAPGPRFLDSGRRSSRPDPAALPAFTLPSPASSSRTPRNGGRAESREVPECADHVSPRPQGRRVPLRQPNVSGRRPR